MSRSGRQASIHERSRRVCTMEGRRQSYDVKHHTLAYFFDLELSAVSPATG